jgi:hypothetical protein
MAFYLFRIRLIAARHKEEENREKKRALREQAVAKAQARYATKGERLLSKPSEPL